MTTTSEEGRRFGLYTGIVANSDDDPEQRGRVQLRIPAILGQEVHPAWALPIGTHLGDGSGSMLVPARGTPVLVMFLDGSPEVPMYLPGPWPRGPAEVSTDPRVPPVQNRYPRRRMWARSHRGGGWSFTESEQGDGTYTNPKRDLSLRFEQGRLLVDVRPLGKVIVNEGNDRQRAARKDDPTNSGSLTFAFVPNTPSTPASLSVTYNPPPGQGEPVVLATGNGTIELPGVIVGGSPSVLIGD